MGSTTIGYNPVTMNQVKTEVRSYNPYEPPKPKGSFFGKLFKGIGAIGAPVGFAASLFFPPAAIAGAGSYGLAQAGSRMDEKAKLKNLDKEGYLGGQQPVGMGFPGMAAPQPVAYRYGGSPASFGGGGGVGAMAPAPQAYQSDVMRVLTLRQDSINDAVHTR